MITSRKKMRSITNPYYLKEANDNGAVEVPIALKKIAHGVNIKVSNNEIYQINSPNYEMQDIFIEQIEFNVNHYDPERLSNLVICKGKTVDFSKLHLLKNPMPETYLDHVGLTLLMTVINQAGKVSHNICSDGFNGVALRDLNMKFKRMAPMSVIKFEYKSEIFERKGQIFAESKWKFSYFDKKRQKDVVFATFETGSQGVARDYDNFKKKV